MLLKIEFRAVDLPSSSSIYEIDIAYVYYYLNALSRLEICKSSKSVGFRSVPKPPFLLPYHPVVAVAYIDGFYFEPFAACIAVGLV